MSRPFWVCNVYACDVIYVLIRTSCQLLDRTYEKYQLQRRQARGEHRKAALVLSSRLPDTLPSRQRRHQMDLLVVASLVYKANLRQHQRQMSSDLRPRTHSRRKGHNLIANKFEVRANATGTNSMTVAKGTTMKLTPSL